jgi:hypoxanthine-DNA glycosylase
MYYAHPRNAFWPILSILTDEALPATNELRRALLLRHGIAVWDTLSSCKREGASDTSIRQEIPTDIPRLINCCPEIAAVFLNGSAAYGYYQKYNAGRVALPYYRLPSTSPANAAGGFEKKLEAWRVLTDYLK